MLHSSSPPAFSFSSISTPDPPSFSLKASKSEKSQSPPAIVSEQEQQINNLRRKIPFGKQLMNQLTGVEVVKSQSGHYCMLRPIMCTIYILCVINLISFDNVVLFLYSRSTCLKCLQQDP